MWLVAGVIFIVLGIGTIAATFIVQKMEDKERIEGFYTTAEVVALKNLSKDNRVSATFEFTKDFKIMKATDTFSEEEAQGLKPGRKALIVYVPETKRVYNNPMRKHRKIQGMMIIAGFLLLLFGVSIGMVQMSV